MISKILDKKSNYANTCIYLDYENIFELLKRYGVTPMQIDFFPKLKKRLNDTFKLNIIDFIVYGNFERTNLFDANHQTKLQSLGVQTRHTSNNGKNSGDLEITVDALNTLHKNHIVDVFILISSDRDIIPLIKAIKAENKITYVISTKNGFNKIVAEYADFHEYIEDIFNLSADTPQNSSMHEDLDFQFPALTEKQIAQAKEVSTLLYISKIWGQYENYGTSISLKGYSAMITGVTSRLQEEISTDFRVAHYLKYVTLYYDHQKGLCIKEGKNRYEVDTDDVRRIG